MTDDTPSDRRRLLALEKTLAATHRQMAGELKVQENRGADELSEPLRAALWSLGVAIVQVVRAQQAASTPAS